ncbi:MAG: aspartyl protease family protein [Anaerolineae bacterium]|nr:aspartyl protease family protein [Gloeobacterales cyanobacterium ES-bin-313]
MAETEVLSENNPMVRFAYKAESVTLPFELVEGLIIIKVRINGKGPYSFVLDTGASGNIIITSELARSLELKKVGLPVIVTGLGDDTVTFSQADVAVVQVGDADLLNQRVTVGDLSDLIPGFDGILSYNFIKMFDLEIDYQNKTLKLSKFKLLEASAQSANSNRIPITMTEEQTPLLKVEIDGHEGIFGIDTGAHESVILYPRFVQRNSLNEKYTKRFSREGKGSFGVFRTEVARSSNLKIGSFSLPGLLVHLSQQKSGASQKSPFDGLIGTGLLKRFTILFSYGNAYIKLEKNDNFDKPDVFSKLGFMFTSPSGNVERVYPKSLASELGIEAGDVVISIDKEPISVLGVAGLRNKISQPPGTVIKITLKKKNNTQYEVNLVLKDIL